MDKCDTVGYFDFHVYNYDNSSENTGAISRTFDYLKTTPCSYLQLAFSKTIENNNLREEYIVGVIHNMADMFSLRNVLKKKAVRDVWIMHLRAEYQNFMAGFYIH